MLFVFCIGIVRWQQPHPPGLSSTLPALSIADLDGDGVKDVALVAPGTLKVNTDRFTHWS